MLAARLHRRWRTQRPAQPAPDPFLGRTRLGGPVTIQCPEFVAYTGYGRIATLGEEVRQPRKTIPRAIVAVLLISMMLYIGVGAVAIAAVGSESFYAATMDKAAPLKVIAHTF